MLQVYRKMRAICLLMLAIGFSAITYGQSLTISGTVTDKTDGVTLIGVTVLEKGTTNGTITDIDGKYQISVNSGATLVFTYVGYAEQEIAVTGSTLNVSLDYQSELLEEIVVIGYGEVKKGDATGSVAAISEEDFSQGSLSSPQELLTGKVAGVQVTTDGAPGGGSTIRIRGSASMTASNDPLFVIDGIPVDNNGINGLANPLSTINPDDIESMSVLKDASATAIYGSRASNGVIIITTKRGKEGSPFKLNYSGKGTFSTVPGYIDVLSADEFRSQITSYYGAESTQAALLGEANTDWQKEILENTFGQEHNISATGSADNLPYYFSLGYLDQKGILKTSEFDRVTAAVSLNPSLLEDHLKLNFNMKTMFTNSRFANQGALGTALTFDPTKPVYETGSQYLGYWEWLQDNDSGNPITIAPANPVGMLMEREDVSNVSRYLGNFQADYKFHFLPELRANLNLAFDISNSNGRIDVPLYARSSWDIDSDGNPNGGTMNYYSQGKKNQVLDFYLNYKKDLESINSVLDVTAGYSYQKFYEGSYSYNSNIPQTEEDISEYVDKREYILLSFFGRLNYTLADKYLVTATIRNDHSSKIHPDNRSGIFPSVAVGWKINEESFLKDVDAISELKLRAGWGVTGQQDIGDWYAYLASYTWGMNNAMYQFGDNFIYTLRPEGYDENLKWEETTTINVGLDYSFARDRIFGSIEYYNRDTEDLLNYISVPAGSNLTNFITTNIGAMTNTGYEFSITGRPVSNQNTLWEVGVNANFNENEITKLSLNDNEDYIGVPVGGISGGVGNNIQIHTVGYPMNSFYVYEQVYDENENPIQGLYVDRNGDGQITDADKYRYHKPTADWTFGANTRFSYKNFDLSAAGHGSFGNYVYNNINSANGVSGQMYNSANYLINVVSDALNTNFTNYEYFSDYYIEDASFFRIDYITAGYTFPKLFNEVSSLNVSFTVQNAFVFTKYSGLDPEVFGGIDNNVYPRSRNFIVGLKLNL